MDNYPLASYLDISTEGIIISEHLHPSHYLIARKFCFPTLPRARTTSLVKIICLRLTEDLLLDLLDLESANYQHRAQSITYHLE